MVGVPAQGEWILTVGDYLFGDTGTLEAWYLETNTGAQVTAGGSVPVVATLSGLDTPFGASRLFAGESLEVNWTYTAGAGVTLSPVVFDVASPASSVEVAATLTATLDATAGVGMLKSNGNGLKNAKVEPAVLPVEIVPRAFTLAFDATTVSVVAGATAQVTLTLTGDTELIGPDEFTVMFSYEPQDGGVSVEEPVTFKAGETSEIVSLIATAIAQDGTMTASVDDRADATFAPATLRVVVREAPPAFQLYLRVLLEGPLKE